MPEPLTFEEIRKIADSGGLVSMTIDHLRQIVGSIGFNKVIDRCSQRFLVEIIYRVIDQSIPGCPAKIASAVMELEQIGQSCGTKSAAPFNHPPLKGLWHKHYVYDGLASMAKNIDNALGKKGLDQIIRNFYNPGTAGVPMEETAKRIANAITAKYPDRSRKRKLTGEWIIFARYENHNYYLCLGKHGDDFGIYKNIKESCIDEFPFLSSQIDLT
jgi:hypothetical protein